MFDQMLGLARVVPLSVPGAKPRSTPNCAAWLRSSAQVVNRASFHSILPFTMSPIGAKVMPSSAK